MAMRNPHLFCYLVLVLRNEVRAEDIYMGYFRVPDKKHRWLGAEQELYRRV